ncbi:LAETG motif-containing sortase-dependent surface protein [Streptomyces sp. TRM49041]|uniref:LAETG motif-containing sortase-dependent surface protein n=1 Tax=Streptomyces sp. TRM49041 TaxID=2603216 RepID=UPI0016568377|nr:LAETG motif-containing sortase-dependent surface protein [Streptomyces sp. TRM49041]
MAAAAVIVAGPLVAAETAHAEYPPNAPSLSIDTTGIAGDPLLFTATGFAAKQQVVAELISKPPVLGTFFAGSKGTVSGTVTIPETSKPGPHAFRVTARDPDLVLSAVINVLPRHQKLPPDGQLPETGSGQRTFVMFGTAVGLLAVGGGAVLVVRRRRTRR